LDFERFAVAQMSVDEALCADLKKTIYEEAETAREMHEAGECDDAVLESMNSNISKYLFEKCLDSAAGGLEILIRRDSEIVTVDEQELQTAEYFDHFTGEFTTEECTGCSDDVVESCFS